MKLFKKIRKYFICIVLAALTIALPVMSSFANNETQKLYVKDIKMVYASHLEEAKSFVPAGYTLLEYDLNKGAEYIFPVPDVYLCYSTTTNPAEAITDMRMMNMNGGFSMSDYEEQMQDVSDTVQTLSDHFKCACDAFVENYKAGTSGAKSAYVALNFFTVDEADDVGLADYLLYGDVSEKFHTKLVLNSHTDILSSILSALTLAVQSEKGNTWLDRLEEIENPKMFVDEYWDAAEYMIPVFENFVEIYNSIDHSLYRDQNGQIISPEDENGEDDPQEKPGDDSLEDKNPSVENTGTEILYEMAYDTLSLYSFKNGTSVAKWLVKKNVDVEDLYPLIRVLTPAEYSMMCLSGPLFMTLATGMDDTVYKNYKKDIEGLIDEVGHCSIWHGVNAELFRSSIGVTDEATRAIAESTAEHELSNDGDTENDTLLKAAGAVSAVAVIALGTGLILSKVVGSILAVCKVSAIAAGFTIAGNFTMIAGVVILCIAAVLALVHVAIWLKEWYDEHHPEYTEIPNYMYDIVFDDEDNSKFVLYEAVKAVDGTNADVNAWEGKEWHAPYVSRDSAAGKPIEADFIIKYGDGRVDEGYAPLRAFGGVVAENLNRYADGDDVKGIFITYRQEVQKGDFAKKKYLSDMKLFSDESEILAKKKLAEEGYTLYDFNVTTSSDLYTFIGYKTSDNVDRALRDIRVCYGYSVAEYSAGGANGTYAASGQAGDLTLYTTRVSTFGSPILSDFVVVKSRGDAPEGYEPVNMITGGPAVNLDMHTGEKLIRKDDLRLLYFLPSETYTSGTKYLSGVATIYDRPEDGEVNKRDSVKKMIDLLGYDVYHYVECENITLEGAVLYSTTYNPYRALYGITAMSNDINLGDGFVQSIRYDGINYSLATRYILNFRGDAVCEQYARTNDARIYTTGIIPNGTPLTPEDIITSDNPNFMKEGYYPLSPLYSEKARPINVSNAFNYTFEDYIHDDEEVTITVEMPPIYVFTKTAPKIYSDYVTDIFISSKESIIGDSTDFDCDEVDSSYLVSSLSSMGSISILRNNLNLEDDDNTTLIGYTKNSERGDPITDAFLYFELDSQNKPERTRTKNGIKYYLVSNINLFTEEDESDSVCNRVYLYITRNPAAGTPVRDICIDNNYILSGWETVLTHNNKTLHNDMDDYSGDMWFLHLKRDAEPPKYIGEVFIGWGGSEEEAINMLVEFGCQYYLNKDLNDNCSIITDYVFLGYNRTNNENAAIRDLRTTHDNPITSFVLDGSTYYRIDGNLNVYTNIFADDIYLYYTKSESAGKPIVNLQTSEDPQDYIYLFNRIAVSTVVNQYDDYSDLNDGAGGDYIYLIMHREYTGAIPSWYSFFGFHGSMLGSGSAIAITACTMVVLATFSIIYIYQKKSKVNKLVDNESGESS